MGSSTKALLDKQWFNFRGVRYSPQEETEDTEIVVVLVSSTEPKKTGARRGERLYKTLSITPRA